MILKLGDILKVSFGYLTANKGNTVLALVPIFLGIVVFGLLMGGTYTWVMTSAKGWVLGFFPQESLGVIFEFTLLALLTVILFFLLNWTFVAITSAIAGPFNDLLSSRIEKMEKSQALPTFTDSITSLGTGWIGVVFNELKKIFVLVVLGTLSLFLSLIPFLVPISLMLTALLLSAQFLDYSWSRHNLKWSACLNDLRRHFGQYLLLGSLFFVLITVPVINLIVSPLATIVYTVFFVRNHGR